ncbi:MAG: hypothetical protein ACTHLZ_18715 [Tepidisphaeraceae bacterium]
MNAGDALDLSAVTTAELLQELSNRTLAMAFVAHMRAGESVTIRLSGSRVAVAGLSIELDEYMRRMARAASQEAEKAS